jgi:hypothetical protein
MFEIMVYHVSLLCNRKKDDLKIKTVYLLRRFPDGKVKNKEHFGTNSIFNFFELVSSARTVTILYQAHWSWDSDFREIQSGMESRLR